LFEPSLAGKLPSLAASLILLACMHMMFAHVPRPINILINRKIKYDPDEELMVIPASPL